MNNRPFSKSMEKLQTLCFKFGNNGKVHTDENHKLIQHLLEENKSSIEIVERDIKFYDNITNECIGAVIKILVKY